MSSLKTSWALVAVIAILALLLMLSLFLLVRVLKQSNQELRSQQSELLNRLMSRTWDQFAQVQQVTNPLPSQNLSYNPLSGDDAVEVAKLQQEIDVLEQEALASITLT